MIAFKIQKGFNSASNELNKEANLLCVDAIMNFRTVQSFGYEDQIVKKYKELLYPAWKASRGTNIQTGIAFGFSQFTMFGIMAGLFYFASLIMEASFDS